VQTALMNVRFEANNVSDRNTQLALWGTFPASIPATTGNQSNGGKVFSGVMLPAENNAIGRKPCLKQDGLKSSSLAAELVASSWLGIWRKLEDELPS
jgi:hypothetical protein